MALRLIERTRQPKGAKYSGRYGKMIDCLNFADGIPNQGDSDEIVEASAVINSTGRFISSTSANTAIDLTTNGDNYEGRSTITIVCRAMWTTLGTRDGLFGMFVAGGWNLNLGYSTSTDLFLYWGTAGDYTPEFQSATGPIETNKMYNIVISYDGGRAAADRVGLYINGHKESFTWAAGPAATLPTTGSSEVHIGSGNDRSAAEFELFASFENAISDGEALALSRNPWRMFQPQERWMAVNVVAVGGATGKANPLSGPFGGPLAGPIGL